MSASSTSDLRRASSSRFIRPMPCSALMLPPSPATRSNTRRWTASARARNASAETREFFQQVRGFLIEAAKDLYSSSGQAFLKVTLPLTMPGIVAGVLLTFIPAFGDYVNAQILGGTGQAMVGNVIQSLYLNQRNYPEAAALSLLMMALILAIVVIYIRFAGTGAFMGDEEESA